MIDTSMLKFSTLVVLIRAVLLSLIFCVVFLVEELEREIYGVKGGLFAADSAWQNDVMGKGWSGVYTLFFNVHILKIFIY